MSRITFAPPPPFPPPASDDSPPPARPTLSSAFAEPGFSTQRPGAPRTRTSIQFAPRLVAAGAVSSARPLRRVASPPPPDTYKKRVSFDTFDNRDAADFSLTLRAKHKDYAYSNRSRTFLCGTDQNDYSEYALEWLIDELVDDGDEVVCLRVVDKDSKINSDTSLEQGRYRLEAQKLMELIQAKNKDNEEKSINIVLEYAVGKVPETIQRMIRRYEPACLIVGTRGRSLGGIQGLLPGSVSKYCLQNSPVPVIVVRPTAKREKKKRKRRADPSRRSYKDIVERGPGSWGSSQALDKLGAENVHGGGGDHDGPDEADEADDDEAAAVAQAIGLPLDHVLARRAERRADDDPGLPLSRLAGNARTGYASGAESPSSMEMRSPESETGGGVFCG